MFDDSPWTDEEMELLAWEAGKMIGWEEMDEYDRYPSEVRLLLCGPNGATVNSDCIGSQVGMATSECRHV